LVKTVSIIPFNDLLELAFQRQV